MKTTITLLVILFLGWLFVWLPINGIHWGTGSGSQVGYVSAVEKSGIVFKTGRVFIKPTLESTQEDVYCVLSDVLISQLKEASVSKMRVEVSHFTWMDAGLRYCNGEGAIVGSFKIL